MALRILALALGVLWSPLLCSQTWPAKPLKLVVPYPPGGSVDAYARLVGRNLAARLGKPVVIENRTGPCGPASPGRVCVHRFSSIFDAYRTIWCTCQQN